MDMIFCQSCCMPMQDNPDLYGSNADGSRNDDYCVYCFKDGAFTADITMEEMIDFCVNSMVEHNPGMTPEKTRALMEEFFPKLKRWQG